MSHYKNNTLQRFRGHAYIISSEIQAVVCQAVKDETVSLICGGWGTVVGILDDQYGP